MVEVRPELKQDLDKRLHELLAYVTEDKKRYCNPNTVRNLIFHFDEIKAEEDRVWVYLALKNYFEALSRAETIDRNTGKQAFYDYLFKVTDYYRTHLGFVMYIPTEYLFFFFFVTFVLLYFIAPFWVSLSPFFLFGLYYFYLFRKYTDKRICSIFH